MSFTGQLKIKNAKLKMKKTRGLSPLLGRGSREARIVDGTKMRPAAF